MSMKNRPDNILQENHLPRTPIEQANPPTRNVYIGYPKSESKWSDGGDGIELYACRFRLRMFTFFHVFGVVKFACRHVFHTHNVDGKGARYCANKRNREADIKLNTRQTNDTHKVSYNVRAHKLPGNDRCHAKHARTRRLLQPGVGLAIEFLSSALAS